MIVIPAVDIKGGKVVRLAQGLAEEQTVYPCSPVEMAEKWASFGVGLIHVVDLDGALQGELKNLRIVQDIVEAVKPKIELGGGIRDLQTIERVLDTGLEQKLSSRHRSITRNYSRTFASTKLILARQVVQEY